MAHDAYHVRLTRTVGGRAVTFAIEETDNPFQLPRLRIFVDGKEVASWRYVLRRSRRFELPDNPGPVKFENVRITWRECAPRSSAPIEVKPIDETYGQILITVEVEKREPFSYIASKPVGSDYVEWCWVRGVRVYTYSWQVRVGILGLREVQAPTVSDRATVVTGRGCWYERTYRPSSSGSSSSSSSSSSGSDSSSSSSRRPAAYRFLLADW